MIDFYEPGPGRDPREERDEDEAATGRIRCIGCGRFLPADTDWNQCADCDTREHGLGPI